MIRHFISAFIMITAIFTTSCKTSQGDTKVTEAIPATKIVAAKHGGNTSVTMLVPIIIYKTHGDYRNLVPVTLNADGTGIISYPAPGDVGRNGRYSTPVEIDDGYLWDRRGISANSAFTDYTYEQYAALQSAPSTDELMSHIKYHNPFSEMYVVEGMRNPTVEQLDSIIKNGFKNCRTIIKNSKKIK